MCPELLSDHVFSEKNPHEGKGVCVWQTFRISSAQQQGLLLGVTAFLTGTFIVWPGQNASGNKDVQSKDLPQT